MTERNDVIVLVQAAHRRIEVLFKRLLLNQKDPGPAVAALHALLTAHFRAEEDLVYPRLDAHHGLAQHKEAEIHLDELRRAAPSTEEFCGALHRLVVAVMEHIADEETTILPMMARKLTPEELAELGGAFAEARQRELDALRGEPRRETRGKGRFGTGKTQMQEVVASL